MLTEELKKDILESLVDDKDHFSDLMEKFSYPVILKIKFTTILIISLLLLNLHFSYKILYRLT